MRRHTIPSLGLNWFLFLLQAPEEELVHRHEVHTIKQEAPKQGNQRLVSPAN